MLLLKDDVDGVAVVEDDDYASVDDYDVAVVDDDDDDFVYFR